MFYFFSSHDDIYSDSVKRLSFPDSLSTRLFSDFLIHVVVDILIIILKECSNEIFRDNL